MNQVEINVIQAETVKASLQRTFYITKPLCIIPNLCGNKKIFAGNAAFCKCMSDELFVFISRCRIKQAVTVLDSSGNCCLCLGIVSNLI